jgi:DNA (cytosine-5)-methyltransferase 1
VFVVGYLGDWRPAAEVLFEPESLRRDTAPSGGKEQEVAGTFTSRSKSGGWNGDIEFAAAGYMRPVLSYDMKQHHNPQLSDTVQLTTKNCSFIRGDTPLVQSYALQGAGSTSKTANGSGWNEEVSFTLNSTDVHGVAQPVAFQLAGDRDNPSVSVSNVAFCLPANPMSDRGQAVAQSMAVRRLTPVECERLQGFPDNYTNIPWRKADESPDGPRYKSLGNSMAVPVMAWIGKRIADYEQQTNGS